MRLKKNSIYSILIALLLALKCVFITFAYAEYSHSSQKVSLKIGKNLFQVEVADTEVARENGLGGREKLAPNAGMLFVFPQVEIQKIWMRGMKIPLDILWLDKQKRIIYVIENASPASFPHVFFADKPAAYVLELNAGAVIYYHLKLGEIVEFPIQNKLVIEPRPSGSGKLK